MTKAATLVREFEENVAAQTDAIERGDHKAGNMYAKRYLTAFTRLRELGNEGREALVPLLEHERADVRVTAAAFLLRFRPRLARIVLEQEAARTGFAAFEAQQALKRWDEGTWSLDPV